MPEQVGKLEHRLKHWHRNCVSGTVTIETETLARKELGVTALPKRDPEFEVEMQAKEAQVGSTQAAVDVVVVELVEL